MKNNDNNNSGIGIIKVKDLSNKPCLVIYEIFHELPIIKKIEVLENLQEFIDNEYSKINTNPFLC